MRFHPSDANAGRQAKPSLEPGQERRSAVLCRGRRRRPSASARTRSGCRPPCSSPRAPTSGWSSSPATMAATSIVWIRFPMKSCAAWRGTGSIRCGSSASGRRSVASQTIKQLCGNQDAVASAYSLYGYDIAHDLGGEPAYRQPARPRLRPRRPAGQRHGPQPHGHRFQLGHRTPGVVHVPPRQPLSRLSL